jgi:hypothetical protein
MEHLVILLIIVGVIDVVISTISHFRNIKNDDLGKQFLETTKAFNQEKEQFRTQLEIKDTIIAALRDKNARQINYDVVRVNAIIAAMQGILSNPKREWKEFYKEDIVGNAISYADYLVETLKKQEENEEKK